MDRRRFLAATGATITVGLAGCSQPEPTVEDANAQSELFGQTKINVVINNSGPKGDVEVLITTYDGNGTVLGKFRRTVTMNEGERREVTFTVDLDEKAERFTAEASAAGYF